MSKKYVFDLTLADAPHMRCFRIQSNNASDLHRVRALIRQQVVSDAPGNFLVSRTIDSQASRSHYMGDYACVEFYVMVDCESWLTMLSMTDENISVNEVILVPREHNCFRGKIMINE
jgi:hypothetical protein